jgi:hypothetical protein
MYLGHGSWVPLVIFGAMFAMRYASSQRRRGSRRGQPSTRSFTDPDRLVPPTTPGAAPSADGRNNAAGTAPAWFRDPFFKHEHRYWSGTEWTEHVNDDGVPGTDPPPPVSGGPDRV